MTKIKFLFFITLTLALESSILAQNLANPIKPRLIQSGVVQNKKNPNDPPPQKNNILENARREIPDTRLGLYKNKAVSIGLDEAITMMLEHNLDIQDQRENIKISEHKLEILRGNFDLKINSDFLYFIDSSPIVSTLMRSTGSDINVTRDILNYNFSFSKPYAFGGLWNFDLTNRRLRTDENFNVLGLEYRTKATTTFTVPLLRGFRKNENWRSKQILKKILDISDLELRQKLINLIARTQASYYELAFAIKNEEILSSSVEEANAQLQLIEMKYDKGKVAASDIAAAQTELQLRRDEAIASQLAITKAENELKTLILDDANSDVWQSAIIPTEVIDTIPQTANLKQEIDNALANRPEIKQLGLQEELNKIDLEFFNNQKQPQLDTFGIFVTQNIIGERNIANPPDEFIGKYVKGVIGIYKFRSYLAGANFSMTIGNTTAKANIEKTNTVTKQLDAQKRKVIQDVIAEVMDAVETVEANAKRIELAHSVVANAEKELFAEKKRFEIGLSTNFLVLEQQNNLSLARGRELRAKVDYIKSYAELKRVTGNNLR